MSVTPSTAERLRHASSLIDQLPRAARPLPRSVPGADANGPEDVFAPGAPLLSEVFSSTGNCGVPVGFVLSQLPERAFQGAPILWIRDRLTRLEAGRPYLGGMRPGLRVIRVDVSRPVDALWAMEEGLRCGTLGAVIAEVWGDPQVLDFTASKRLALRSEASGVPAWLVRRAATAHLSAARRRWRLSPRLSLCDPHDPQAPGQIRWEAELFRTRTGKPGHWHLTPGPDRLEVEIPSDEVQDDRWDADHPLPQAV
ncbi:ImuA family protein [Aestuariibius insulae]|uniref:ImuA family protein n=1 Tax=Aestuariibius insulae TaxID=2058287 RepID=UPI00345E4A82